MKITILTLFITSVISISSYGFQNDPQVVKSKYSEVKIFEQPSTGSPVILTLEENQIVNYIRKSAANGGGWSIVFHEGRPGYVLSNELYEDVQLTTKSRKKVNKNLLSSQKKNN